MKRLLNFLYRFRGLFIFLFLEFLSFYLIVQNNRYQSAAFFSSANILAANISNTTNGIREYFILKINNEILAEENAQLKKLIEKLKTNPQTSPGDSILIYSENDSTDFQYDFVTAKVINNTTQWRSNTLTLNKGTNDGISFGQGVVGDNGLVGKIKYVNQNFSVVTSLLHAGFTVSSRIKNKVEVCTTEWDGVDPKLVKIQYVPRHHTIEVGDTVMTSGYNAVFPPDMTIAIINKVELRDDANFYDITAEISNDFTTLSYVHVVVNKMKIEKDSIENIFE